MQNELFFVNWMEDFHIVVKDLYVVVFYFLL